MKPVLLGRFEPDSPEWHAARVGRLGGSDIAAVVGLSPWDSRYSLWMRKAGQLDDHRENPGIRWGTILEPVVRDVFLSSHPHLRPVRGTARNAGSWLHPDHAWALCNPDGIFTDGRRRCLYEGKTAHGMDAWKWGPSGTDEVPPYYLTQVRWGMWVLGLDVCHLAVLIGGQDYREYVIEPDPDDTDWLVAAGAEFIETLHAGTPPSIDDSAHTYQAVRERVPDVDRDRVAIIPDDAADALHATRAAARQAEADARHASSVVLDLMGDAHEGTTADGRRVATRTRRKTAAGYGAPYLTPARTYQPTHMED